jgi:hypothetical protein
MRTETINASDGATVTLVVPPLPGQCWEAMRIPSQGAKFGAAIGLLLAAGGIAVPGRDKSWRPTPLHRHRGTFEDWGWHVYNAVCVITGWSPFLLDRVGMAAIALMSEAFITAEDLEAADGFFSGPLLSSEDSDPSEPTDNEPQT